MRQHVPVDPSASSPSSFPVLLAFSSDGERRISMAAAVGLGSTHLRDHFHSVDRHQLRYQESKFLAWGGLDLRSDWREVLPAKLWCPPHLPARRIGLIACGIAIGVTCSPLGPMSSSARKPSGPVAMLVGIPRDICR